MSKFKVFKIGLRQQLIVLVLLVTSFSLMILAIITGVYFTANYRNERVSRLEVIAQMKASQVQQTLSYQYYQAYWLSIRDTIQQPMINYRAGNTSSSNWIDAEATIQQFLSSSATFTNVRLYDSKFTRVVTSLSNWSLNYVPEQVLDSLFPLDEVNITLSSSLDAMGVLTGPVINDTDAGAATFVMSMTLPIYTSGSILVESTDLAGYLTAVMSAQGLLSITNDLSLATTGTYVRLLKALDNETYTGSSLNYSEVVVDYAAGLVFSTNNSYPADQVLRLGRTGSTHSTYDGNNPVAAGYSPVSFNMTKWGVVIEQSKNIFLAPAHKLNKIIIGVVFGIAVFMAIITFPLAHWAVQPILRLQKATETIVRGRGLQVKDDDNSKKGDGVQRANSSRGSSSSVILTQGVLRSMGGNRSSHENGSLSSGPYSPQDQHGTYISEARVPEYSRFFQDELSKLTETFNVMTDELDGQYTQLEDRVKARTKQLEAAKIQAEAANEAKTVFIANISHELRTPLNGILGMTAIAMAENDQSKIQHSLKLIFRSGELLLHILTELLTFSKNQLKRSKLENSEFTATEVALQMKSIFGKLARDQHVNLSISLKPNDIRTRILYGDSNRIIQIVMNLVSNSLKFTPIEGSVSVIIRVVGEYDAQKSEKDNHKHVYVKHESDFSEDEKHSSSDDALFISSKTNSSISDLLIDEKIQSSDEADTEQDDLHSINTTSTPDDDENVVHKQLNSKEFSLLNELTENNFQMKSLGVPKTWVFEFVVEDTGPGIDPKLQKSVFEPFVQGDQTLSRQYGGTGLGLSICTQLAAMMNGVIELESTVGVGSKFTFRVPLLQTKELIVPDGVKFYEDEFNVNSRKNRKVRIVEPESEAKPEGNGSEITPKEIQNDRGDITDTNLSKTAESPFEEVAADKIKDSLEELEYFGRPVLQKRNTSNTKASSIHSHTSQSTNNAFAVDNLKILVAEDNKVNQEVIKRMLNLEGFSDIALAIDGEEVYNYVVSIVQDGSKPYDIIFMDVQMPKVDGLEATTRIRKLGYHGPIVALTAFSDESNVRKCLDAGMNGFLAKPIRRSQLRKILLEYCPVILQEAVTTPISDKTEKPGYNSKNNTSDDNSSSERRV